MKRNTFLAALAAAALFAGSAWALVLTDKSPEQKLRKDIQKQQAKYVDCLVKAALKCEKSGTTVNAECVLATGTGPDAKFPAAIAKCESKVDYTKKSFGDIASDYDAIGCPGDSDGNSGNGDQPYSDLVTYEAGANETAKSSIDLIGALVGALSNCGTDPDPNKCSIKVAKALGGYAKDVYKCMALCENDYKDKKGNGGPSDGSECLLDPDGTLPYVGGSAAFNACAEKARAKADKKGAFSGGLAGLAGNIHTVLSDANNDLFNENEVCP